MTDTIEPEAGYPAAAGSSASSDADGTDMAALDLAVEDGEAHWPPPKSAEDFNRELRQRRFRLLVLLGFFGLAGVLWGVTVILLILLIVVSIFLHELGHYVAAKRSGMKVTEFFIGFGPRIWSFRRGDTEYGIKVVWAGAYVKIIGMNNLDEVAPRDEPYTYRRMSYPKRVVVAFAGPAMNLVFAFVLLVGLAMAWGAPPSPTEETFPAVDVSEGSAAEIGGLESGDRIISVDGEAVPEDFGLFSATVAAQPGEDIEMVVERDGEEVALQITLGDRIMGISGITWPSLSSVNPGSGGAAAGLAHGDEIVMIDGDPAPETFDEFEDVVAAAAGGTVVLEVAREEGTYGALLVVPEGTVPDGFLGISQHNPEPDALGPVEAVTESGSYMGAVTKLSAEGLIGFFSPSGLTGFAELIFSPADESSAEPVVVAQTSDPETSEVVETSLTPLPARVLAEDQTQRVNSIIGVVQIGRQLNLAGAIVLMAWLNIFLALFNLVPLLPFDGGHIAVATYERLREALNRVGLLKAKLVGGRYMADFGRLIPITYAVVAVVVFVGLGALYLDIVDPTELPS